MSLEDKLAAVRDGAPNAFRPNGWQSCIDATEQLRNSGILDHVIKPGARAPEFTLNDQNGSAVALSALTGGGPV